MSRLYVDLSPNFLTFSPFCTEHFVLILNGENGLWFLLFFLKLKVDSGKGNPNQSAKKGTVKKSIENWPYYSSHIILNHIFCCSIWAFLLDRCQKRLEVIIIDRKAFFEAESFPSVQVSPHQFMLLHTLKISSLRRFRVVYSLFDIKCSFIMFLKVT